MEGGEEVNFDTLGDESRIHQILSKKRVFGEWFELKPEDLSAHLYVHGGKSSFWWTSNTLFAEIDRQLEKFCPQYWGEERRLIREELITLVEYTLCIGDQKKWRWVVEQLIPQGLRKCYFSEYEYITGKIMSRYEYILGILVGINLAFTTEDSPGL